MPGCLQVGHGGRFHRLIRTGRFCFLGLMTVVLNVSPEAGASFDGSVYHEETLHAHGIPTNFEGLACLLDELTSSHDSERSVQQLMGRLRSNDYRERVLAAAALGRTMPFPQALLEVASGSPDADLSRRARQILLNRRNDLDYLVYAALEYIAAEQIPGLIPRLARFLPVCKAANQRVALRFALVHSAAKEDALTLKALLNHKEPAYRIMAVHALSRVFAGESHSWIRVKLGDAATEVQLEAATRLAEGGEEDGFRHLVSMLNHEEVNIRGQAIFSLRILAGQTFGFDCRDDEVGRRLPVMRWQQWVEDQQGVFSIAGRMDAHYLHPRIMLCMFDDRVVQELDVNGTVVSELRDNRRPWAIQLLPNGHKLVSWRNGSYRLTQHDLAGREIWRCEAVTSQSSKIQFSPDGTIWMAPSNQLPKVITINRTNNRVHERPFDPSLGPVVDGERGADGDWVLLFGRRGFIRKIDRNGIIRREIRPLDQPFSMQALPGEQLLMVDGGKNRVVELDGQGNVTWEYPAGGDKLYRAQRLPGGNTLISTNEGLSLVAPAKEVIWSLKTRGPVRAWQF